jgi:hypothetical protein
MNLRQVVAMWRRRNGTTKAKDEVLRRSGIATMPKWFGGDTGGGSCES